MSRVLRLALETTVRDSTLVSLGMRIERGRRCECFDESTHERWNEKRECEKRSERCASKRAHAE